MSSKEGYFEKLARLTAEERQQAGLRALKRAIDEGKFPETEDTINAFSTGYYAAFEYRAARKTAGEASSARPASMMLFMLGGMLLAAVALVWWEQPTNLAPQAIFAPFVSVALIGLGYLALRRARRREQQRDADYRKVWG